MPQENKEKSIVTIIQTMLSTGKTADEILTNLKDMNVPEDQAKTLLMIAQTNALAVLKGDVIQMVNEQIALKYPDLEKQLTKIINDKTLQAQNNIYNQVSSELKKSVDTYNAKQKDTVDKVLNVSVEQDQKIEIIKQKLNELGTNYDRLALGSTKTLVYLRLIAFGIGVGCVGLLTYKLFTLMPGYSIDYLIFYTIVGLLAAILLVLSLI